MITRLYLKIIIFLLIIIILNVNKSESYTVDVNVKDSSRNVEVNYCALKKTNVEDDYNNIIYNFTYYFPSFNGCFNYINSTSSLFEINGTIYFNESYATVYFFQTNETFTISNGTNFTFSLADRTTINLFFNESIAIISLVDYNRTLYINETNNTTKFNTSVSLMEEKPESMAIFLPLKRLRCSLRKVVSNVATKLTQIVIFGGDGPYVRLNSF
jgi:hypothetical protein